MSDFILSMRFLESQNMAELRISYLLRVGCPLAEDSTCEQPSPNNMLSFYAASWIYEPGCGFFLNDILYYFPI
jgi:hypothetical protein